MEIPATYLRYAKSTYKSGGIVIGSSSGAAPGNGLTDHNTKIIQIPSIYNEKPVIELGYEAFRATGITQIFIPKSILYINDYCFCVCSKLTEIRFRSRKSS